MHGFIEEFAEGIFVPDQVRLLTDAFDGAWSRVQASKAPRASEFDPRWLADSALLYLTQQKLTRELPSGTRADEAQEMPARRFPPSPTRFLRE